MKNQKNSPKAKNIIKSKDQLKTKIKNKLNDKPKNKSKNKLGGKIKSSNLKIDLNFDSKTKLIPAIIQDSETKEILMHAYMNQESLKLTLKTRKVTFFSRSRKTLWTKGETSGNYLNLVSISTDCDKDTLLIQAQPDGPTCHLGTTSCFDKKTSFSKSSKKPNKDLSLDAKKASNLNNLKLTMDLKNSDHKNSINNLSFLINLENIINNRFAKKSTKKSYVNSLIISGLDKIIQKVGEEATETVIAAKNKDKKEFIYESSDLLFHFLVLLRAKKTTLSEIIHELKSRHK